MGWALSQNTCLGFVCRLISLVNYHPSTPLTWFSNLWDYVSYVLTLASSEWNRYVLRYVESIGSRILFLFYLIFLTSSLNTLRNCSIIVQTNHRFFISNWEQWLLEDPIDWFSVHFLWKSSPGMSQSSLKLSYHIKCLTYRTLDGGDRLGLPTKWWILCMWW